MSFLDALDAARQRNNSLLCIGLDPLPQRIPQILGDDVPAAVVAFNRAIIAATSDLVCAYKPNTAFYEALGPRGWWALAETVRAVPLDVPVIVDGKRGDIGSTAEQYASAMFDELGAGACTVSPYMGEDSVAPFTREGRFAFVLCHTSNPGAAEFQELEVVHEGRMMPLYEAVARRVSGWSAATRCGLVVGATYPETLARVVAAAPTLPLLIPGLGTQSGDLEAVLAALAGRRAVVNVARQVTYASTEGSDFAEAARRAAEGWRDRLNGAGAVADAVGER